MTADLIRSTIVDALRDADAGEHVDDSRLALFEVGEADIVLSDLSLDSLTRMELLVALEMEFGTVILPDVFAQFRSLSDIVAHVATSGAGLELAPDDDQCRPSAPEAKDVRREPSQRIARLFRRAFVRCRTVAEMHLLLSHLADRMSPLEVETFRDWQRQRLLIPEGAPAKFEAALSVWMDSIEAAMRRSGKSEPEPFASRRISPAVMHYSGPGGRAGKTLLVGFSVKGSRTLSITQAVFLQHVDARQYDMLMISDLWATAFRGGVPIIGADVHEVVRWVANLPLLREYARVRVVGCSAGVYPAMLAGRAIGAEVVVGLNGRFPSERYLGVLARMYFHCWRSSRRNREARVLLVHGVTKRRDVAYARRLGWLTGVSRLAIGMPDRDLDHNVLPPLVEHGELAYFLERTLFAALDSAWFGERRASSTVRFPVERAAAD